MLFRTFGRTGETVKPMGGGFLLRSKAITAAEYPQYALSQPTSVVIHGMDKMEHLEEALHVIQHFQAMPAAQSDALAARTKQAALSGKYELYKTTAHFDSTAQHPNWLGCPFVSSRASSFPQKIAAGRYKAEHNGRHARKNTTHLRLVPPRQSMHPRSLFLFWGRYGFQGAGCVSPRFRRGRLYS